jgi:GTPase KRas protein
VYSITSRATFDRLEIFHQLLVRHMKHSSPILLVGNKANQDSERQVSREEGSALAHRFGFAFYETSAKIVQNIERPFIHLIQSLRQEYNLVYGPIKKKPSRNILSQ